MSSVLTHPCVPLISPAPLPSLQVGRAGRFGTKGLAITFVSSQKDSEVLNQVQERFDVDIKPLPDKIDSRCGEEWDGKERAGKDVGTVLGEV